MAACRKRAAVGRVEAPVAILNGNPDIPATRARVVAFQQGLGALGWREGSNISFEVRWGAADAARIHAYAAELVKLKPDVILATNTPTAHSLKLATDTIPIVFAGLADPIGDGIVTNLSKPGAISQASPASTRQSRESG